MPTSAFSFPHRRLNALTNEWILVSPHRAQRPWQGQVERTARPAAIHYDPQCYLCPGNPRAGGAVNPDYSGTFVFENDFAALKPDIPRDSVNQGGLLVAEPERGICRVVCFSPDHSLTVARMEEQSLRRVVDTWVEQYVELSSIPWVRNVQIFENRGEMMGASNPHPHGQIWSTEAVPNEIAKESAAQQQYAAGGNCLLCDYLVRERSEGERVVCENEHFAVLVPFWAVWPFETILISKRHFETMGAFTEGERSALADILRRITTRYDNLFETPFPYSMGFHQQANPNFHFHGHFYPPLLRSATVRKFMVGFELLGMPQRDITAESAAERLRQQTEQHYLEA